MQTEIHVFGFREPPLMYGGGFSVCIVFLVPFLSLFSRSQFSRYFAFPFSFLSLLLFLFFFLFFSCHLSLLVFFSCFFSRCFVARKRPFPLKRDETKQVSQNAQNSPVCDTAVQHGWNVCKIHGRLLCFPCVSLFVSSPLLHA